MASILPRAFARRPYLSAATLLTVSGAAAVYLSAPSPLRLDSADNAPLNTLTFPKTMLLSRQLKVKDVQQINHDTKRITFQLPGGDSEVSGVSPGGAILTQHTPAGAWFPVFRPYTPVHDLSRPGVLQLLVKHYPGGRASSHLHSLQPGDDLTVRGPLPGYTYRPSPSQARGIILIAGGAGITPIFSLTQGILSDPAADKTTIHLVWGVNGTRDIILRDELAALQKRFPGRVHITYAVSGPEAAPEMPNPGPEETFRKGYVDRALLEQVVARCRDNGGGSIWGDEAKGTKVFLCGPPKMEEALAGKQGVLAQMGVEKKNVYRF